MSEFKSRKFVATFDSEDIKAGNVYETFFDHDEGYEYFLDEAGDPRRIESHINVHTFMQLIPEPTTSALQIEEGRYYLTRDGRKVGPIVINLSDNEHWPFHDKDHEYFYKNDGYSCPGAANRHNPNDDLISEYKETEIKVGDSGTTKELIAQQIIDGKFPKSYGDQIKNSPVQYTLVNKIISGDYGRLRIKSDGYHSLNLSIIDGKSRCVSVDEMREMVRVLEEIILAREI